MKRKIEAKLKNRTESSDASFAQELAVTIMDKSDGTPNQSPTVQSPEAARESYSTIANRPANNLLMPFSDKILPSATPEPQNMSPSSLDPTEKSLASFITPTTSINGPRLPSPQNEDLKMIELGRESDDEGRLVAQLEKQRLAEEEARERRRKLEQRLALARRQKSLSPVYKREGRATERPQDGTSSLSVSRAPLIF
jgi:hypothetical protein